MTDTVQTDSDAEENGPVGGGRLAAARIENEKSLRDIAKELHLDEPTVLAIENNDFAMLGAPVFVKGHLRKYAELVQVPVDDVIADYYEMTRSEGPPPVVTRVRPVDRTIAPGRWIVGALAVLVAGGAGYWWFTRPPATTVARPEPATLAPPAADRVTEPPRQAAPTTVTAPEPATAEPSADEAESDDTVPEETEPDVATGDPGTESTEPELAAAAADVTETVVDEAPAPGTAEPTAQAPAAGAETVVVLTFSGDCWTEITDASGRRIFYDLGTAGAGCHRVRCGTIPHGIRRQQQCEHDGGGARLLRAADLADARPDAADRQQPVK